MNRFDQMGERWYQFREKMRPAGEKTGRFFKRLGEDIATIIRYMYKLRAIILCAPVAAVAVVLASINTRLLPEAVSFLMPGIEIGAEDALFGFLVFDQIQVDKGGAIISCLILTLICLGLTLLSKRTLYPWLISVFTLVMPLFLRVTNDPAVLDSIMSKVSELVLSILK